MNMYVQMLLGQIECRLTMSQCYNVTMLQCYTVTLLHCYNVTMLQCYTVTLSQFYNFTTRKSELITFSRGKDCTFFCFDMVQLCLIKVCRFVNGGVFIDHILLRCCHLLQVLMVERRSPLNRLFLIKN